MNDNTIMTVLGRKGSGKTTLTKAIAREWARVVVLDWNGEYTKADGYVEVTGGPESARALVDASGKRRYRLSLRVPTREETEALFGVIAKLRDALVIVEEASVYCSPSYLPDGLAMLVRYGRHNGLSQIYVARRPSELNRDLTAQSDVIVTFQQQEPRDLEYLRAMMGSEGDRARTLPAYAIVAWGARERMPLSVLEREENPT